MPHDQAPIERIAADADLTGAGGDAGQADRGVGPCHRAEVEDEFTGAGGLHDSIGRQVQIRERRLKLRTGLAGAGQAVFDGLRSETGAIRGWDDDDQDCAGGWCRDRRGPPGVPEKWLLLAAYFRPGGTLVTGAGSVSRPLAPADSPGTGQARGH